MLSKAFLIWLLLESRQKKCIYEMLTSLTKEKYENGEKRSSLVVAGPIGEYEHHFHIAVMALWKRFI